MKNKILAKNKEHLNFLIQKKIEINGNTCDLNHIDTSLITDMSYLFNQSQFNGNIFNWNVSQVTDMIFIFSQSKFRGDINQWDVSHVKYMQDIFYNCESNRPWWAIDNNEQRILAIEKYHLMKKIDKNLITKNDSIIQSKKIKI